MALSPQDRAYYEEKLGWKGFMYLCIATGFCGAIALPLLLYYQDYTNGQVGNWSFPLARNFGFDGMFLGIAMSVILFSLARFYLWLGWLPRRR